MLYYAGINYSLDAEEAAGLPATGGFTMPVWAVALKVSTPVCF